jgi:hypothetical protein
MGCILEAECPFIAAQLQRAAGILHADRPLGRSGAKVAVDSSDRDTVEDRF